MKVEYDSETDTLGFPLRCSSLRENSVNITVQKNWATVSFLLFSLP